MARLAAQPAEKGSLEQLGIEPIRLRPAMLARYGNTCRVDHISLDAASPQPPRQPEAVPAGFVGHRDPIDRAACLGRFVPPAIQQLEQRRLIGHKFLQRLSVDPRNYAGDQPGRSAHLNDGDECAILIQSGERAAQVIRLLHGAPRRLLPATMMPSPRRSPHSISCGPYLARPVSSMRTESTSPTLKSDDLGDAQPGTVGGGVMPPCTSAPAPPRIAA